MLDNIGLHFSPNILVSIGFLLTTAFLGSKIFQHFGIPQVVGYIFLGTLLGSSFLNIIPLELASDLEFISLMALGLIGFDMGSHLKLDELRRLGKSLTFILLFEAVGTFALVSVGIYLITQSLHTALIFGALASATAPAATVDVLAEYDAKGPLTTSLLAVVGLDDALALFLYSITAVIAENVFIGSAYPSLFEMISLPLIEIGGSLILGIVMGFILNRVLCKMQKLHDSMAIAIGFVLLAVGLSEAMSFSLILTTLIMGMVVINQTPRLGKDIRYIIEQAGPVIYVLFFALVGVRFQIRLLPAMGLLGLAYVGLRSIGKFSGAWIGSWIGGAEPAVRDNLGFGLLSQAGVAIGLALASANRFSEFGEEGKAFGSLIINIITSTTFVVQIIGPIFVKVAISRAGEIGKALTTEDDWGSEAVHQSPWEE
jgi:Kef-type K+ transport system membrane component KefB